MESSKLDGSFLFVYHTFMPACSKCKKIVASFPITKNGKPSTMCQNCYDWMKVWNAAKHERGKTQRANLAPGMGFCMACKKTKPESEFDISPFQRRKIANGEKTAKNCAACRERAARNLKSGRNARHSNPEVKAKHLAERRGYNRGFRIKLLEAYGPYCRCCGETTPEFLELHHVNEDGAEHRRQIGRGPEALYRWAERHGFPDTLAVTCANCHAADTYYGGCPHKKLSVMELVQSA